MEEMYRAEYGEGLKRGIPLSQHLSVFTNPGLSKPSY
jgi:hypothetical protein